MVTPLLAMVAGVTADASDCAARLRAPVSTVETRRAVQSTDLVALRDFGRQEASVAGEPPFSVSPDGRHAALVVRRADPDQDGYCFGVAVVQLDRAGPARWIDVGGDPILEVSDSRGQADLPIGNLKTVTPAWSPDGRWLAYLRRDRGQTRVWLAKADGRGATAVPTAGGDARAVRWSKDGQHLIVTTRPGVGSPGAGLGPEERTGYLFGKQFWPLSQSRPSPSAATPEVEQTVRATDGTLSPPSVRDREHASVPPSSTQLARSPAGNLAWISETEPGVILGPVTLHARVNGRSVRCDASTCADTVANLWWIGETLYFAQAGTAQNGGITTLGRWQPGSAEPPKVVLSTSDALLGCQAAAGAIICAHEAATRPRTLVRINPATGTMTTLFDPNPEFPRHPTRAVRRLRWQLDNQAQSYGDLVLPPGHREGMRHPLVIVQYRSRGFLRGGTGDEYPILTLAARGYTVLSVERAPFPSTGKARTLTQFIRMNAVDFADRRRQLRSIEAGIGQAVALGVVDPSRIGITGLSDGAAGVQFALIHSSLFRAAAISSCCDGAASIHFAADRGYGELLTAAGFPGPGDEGNPFWKDYSLAANATKLRTPILMQLTEDEYRLGLETFVTLEHAKVPVEMFVFAGSYHQKWRPAQRLAVYERAIDWFDYWLSGKTDPAPYKSSQYRRWDALKARQPR